ncbi:DUF1571 domain-containing protein [Allorhodopirellula heiligendammensis]|uniref:Uncharacterized protein n=1 Tax=Allorhodopirellula heiligendammensis TaxID=2714739 RepID=A0A5C6C347_9BACT|nr:DUF1571 domain-containing protein [Allorhodopirellula heiligendammensis]TWU18505.1 hypothetical protein Poly21_06680 [Allorhodopirellula heiligendammensis]
MKSSIFASNQGPSRLSAWRVFAVPIGLSLIFAAQPLRGSDDEASLNEATGNMPSSADTTDLGRDDARTRLNAEAIDEAAAMPVDHIGPGKQPPDSLQPLIEFARKAKIRFENEIDAYTCLLVKRETLEDGLEPAQYILVKIRERRAEGDRLLQPQSLYAKFLKPHDVAGREVLYVENQRDGDLLVRRGGTRLPNLTLELNPEGRLAKSKSNYSILQTGIRPMLEQILDRMESQIDPANIKIRYFADAKVDGRPCQHIEVRQIEHTPDAMFQVAKVYIDNELELPVYFSSYAWSDTPDGEPILQEQYAITKIDLKAKLTDLDFDRTNPAYQFRPEDEDQHTGEDGELPTADVDN